MPRVIDTIKHLRKNKEKTKKSSNNKKENLVLEQACTQMLKKCSGSQDPHRSQGISSSSQMILSASFPLHFAEEEVVYWRLEAWDKIEILFDNEA